MVLGPVLEAAAVRWLATGEGNLTQELASQLDGLKQALEAESDVAIVFGSAISGAAIANLVEFGSRLPGKTRYMALGDYANSRGAADMGLLPDRLPGYSYLDDKAAVAALEKHWGGEMPSRPGMTAPQMMEAAQSGKLKRALCDGSEPAGALWNDRIWPRQGGVADRARNVPDGNFAAGGHRFPRGFGI